MRGRGLSWDASGEPGGFMKLYAVVVTSLLAGCTQSSTIATPPPQPVARAATALTATQDTVLTLTPPVVGQQAGAIVALSADGTLAAVGVPRDPFTPTQATLAGSVRIFSRVAGAWTETATVRSPTPTVGAQFGLALSLSGDGSRLLVGAPLEDGMAGADVGAARVYVRTGSAWALEATLPAVDLVATDYSGIVVALSVDGARAFVSAVGDESAGGPTNAGAVRVYVRNASGWNLETTLTSAAAAADDAMGFSLATNGDGSRLLVGVRSDDTDAGVNAGTVRVFVRTGSTWAEDATISASDAMPGDQFGNALALSADGLVALVGVSNDDTDAGVDTGSVRPFALVGGIWVEQPPIFAPDVTSVPGFGTSVALRADGARAVIGAPQAAATNGAARVYTLEPTGWAADTALTIAPPIVRALVGSSVAISANGEVILVGVPNFDAPADNAGGAALFSLVGLTTGFGCSTASQCATGNCVDGFCCDTSCGAGAAACQGCSMAKTGLPNGTCGLAIAGRVCRPAVGLCDLEEQCDGTSPLCPRNQVVPFGLVCRSALGPCDAPEQCNGVAGACPSDVLRVVGTQCAPASGLCDDPDLCNGTDAFCQPRYKPAGTICDTSISGSCDTPDTCTGTAPDCRPKHLVNVVCREAVSPCDRAEICGGGSVDCPPDQVVQAGLPCRVSSNPLCNPSESCDGVSAMCPADVNSCRPGEEIQMCPPAPVCPTCPEPRIEPARGCLQIGPGGPALVEFLLATAFFMSRRRRSAAKR